MTGVFSGGNFLTGLVFGFDVGTGSIGYAVRKGTEFKHVGVLICPEDTNDLSGRRGLRRQRRTLRSRKYRRQWFTNELIKLGLPKPAQLSHDPISLRLRALNGEELKSDELYAALTHLFKRRGYQKPPWTRTEKIEKENSKPKKDDEEGEIKKAVEGIRKEMAEKNCQFPCQLLDIRQKEIGDSPMKEWARKIYWPRELLEQEFRAILKAQENRFPQLAAKADWLLYGDTREVKGFHVFFNASGSRNPGVLGFRRGERVTVSARSEHGVFVARQNGETVLLPLDNTDPIPKIWDQMSLAKQYGADRIWIVNVGHFKGYEFPLEFFMNLAWNTPRWTSKAMSQYPRLWAEQQFGPKYAAQIGDILTLYTKYNGRRKPELLDANTYSVLDYDEFQKVVTDYEALADKAGKISAELPPASRDAFYELVLFPTKACAQLNAMYLAAAKNHLYVAQGRASANDFAAKTHELFAAETNLMNYFNHDFVGGKWDHFMDQPFIGYRSWNDPKRNNLNSVGLTEIQVPRAADMGVAVENSEIAATNGEISLPQFDVFNQQRFYVEVFNRGKTPFDFSATPDSPWIKLSDPSGTIKKQKRIWVSVDWSKAPNGTHDAGIKFSGAGEEVVVKTTTFKPSEPTRESLQGFAEGDGYVSMEAAHYTQRTDAGSNRWLEIPNYGKTLSGMRACGPIYVQATPGKDSPCLKYKMYLFHAGKVDVESIVGSTLNFLPGRPLRYAVSFDDERPRTVTIVPANFNANSYTNDWPQSVEDNYRNVQSTFTIEKAGYHTLKIWMVDPGVVLEKIVVDGGGMKPSYLGPPESFRR